MSNKRKIEVYRLEQSPFWRIGRQKDVAALLNVNTKRLKALARDREEFYWTKEEVINGKHRKIACPTGPMRRLHDRLKALLNRIEQPDYLFSPRHGRSATMNAMRHAEAKVVVKLDIRQFYPSTTDEHIFRFFRHKCGMADDVAGILTKLCTFQCRLPFGSPMSPVLCALVHRDLFDEIGATCDGMDLNLSLWVDDVTLSGDEINDQTVFRIKQAIAKSGLAYHKVRKSRVARGVTITGTYISNGGAAPANKSHVKMRDKLDELDHTSNSEDRLSLVRSLIGLNVHMATVYAADHPAVPRLLRQRAWLHNERRRMERMIAANSEMKLDLASAEREASLAHELPPWE